jgi:hypothetical protein
MKFGEKDEKLGYYINHFCENFSKFEEQQKKLLDTEANIKIKKISIDKSVIEKIRKNKDIKEDNKLNAMDIAGLLNIIEWD